MLTFQLIGDYVKRYIRIKRAHEAARADYLALTSKQKDAYCGPVVVKYTWKQLPWSTKRKLQCDWLMVTLCGLIALLASCIYQLGEFDLWRTDCGVARVLLQVLQFGLKTTVTGILLTNVSLALRVFSCGHLRCSLYNPASPCMRLFSRWLLAYPGRIFY
jgi:hypothetical protein